MFIQYELLIPFDLAWFSKTEFCKYCKSISIINKAENYPKTKNWSELYVNCTKVSKPGASLVDQTVKALPVMQETQVQSLSLEDPLEKEMATHSITLAWKIPWQRNLVGSSPCGHKESDMTEWFHLFSFL